MTPPEIVIEARVRRWRVLEQPWLFVFLVIGGARGLIFEVWAFGLLAIAMLLLVARNRWRSGVLRATRDGLTMDGKPFARWSRVTAVVQAGDSDVLIRCRRHGLIQNIACELDGAAAARRLEELARSRVRSQQIDLASFRVLWLVLLFMLAVFASLEYPVTAAAALAAVALPLILVRRPVAAFGTDGILKRGYFSRRFTRGDRISDCRAHDAELVSVERAGEAPLNLHLPAYGRLGEEYALSIQRRVLELRAAVPELSEAQHGILRRGERSVREWLAALRDPTRAAHRGVLPRALLWQVAEVPGPEEERAAALAALGPTLEPDERARVGEIGRALVSRRLRLAVDAVLGGDDRQIEQALRVASAAPH